MTRGRQGSAVQFGAGNIGRGFLGQLFYESGYATTFIEVRDDVVEALNARGGYPLREVDNAGSRTRLIGNVRAIHGRDARAVAEAVARADIVATAVGAPILDRIANPLAQGLALRFSEGVAAAPLDIIVCENLNHAGPFLREKVRARLDPLYHTRLDDRVGFVEASIGRMVPVMSDAARAEDPLLIEVEPYCVLPVDAAAFRGPIPAIAHLAPRSHFQAIVERKLFVHNMGHAVTGYLGHLRGHGAIWQAIADPKVRAVVVAAMGETCEALARAHGDDRGELLEHANDLIDRFGNRALGDQVARVARDPLRKLGREDRLVGAMRRCLDHGVSPEHVALGAAAALRYDAPDDPAASEVRALVGSLGPRAALRTIAGLDAGSPILDIVEAAWDRLS